MFDEQVDMQTPTDLVESKPADETRNITSVPELVKPSYSTTETSASDHVMLSAVRPCSTQSEYEAVMERLKQPVTSEDVVQVQGRMQTLSERPRIQQQRDGSELELRVLQVGLVLNLLR